MEMTTTGILSMFSPLELRFNSRIRKEHLGRKQLMMKKSPAKQLRPMYGNRRPIHVLKKKKNEIVFFVRWNSYASNKSQKLARDVEDRGNQETYEQSSCSQQRFSQPGCNNNNLFILGLQYSSLCVIICLHP